MTHTPTHHRNQAFHCDQCGKDFIRKDNLKRHLLTHQTSEPSLLQRKARACSNCAIAKVRCSGHYPVCSRCRARGEISCRYPQPSHTNISPISTNNGDAIEIQGSQHTSDVAEVPMSTVNTANVPLMTMDTSMMSMSGDPTLQSMQDVFDFNFNSDINWLSPDHFSPLDSFHLGSIGSAHAFFSGQPFLNQHFTEQGRDQRSDIDSRSHHRYDQIIVEQDAIAGNNAAQAAATAESENNAPSAEEHHEGEYYVDGQTARLPRVKRRRLTAHTKPTDDTAITRASFQPCSLDLAFTKYFAKRQISNESYESLAHNCRSVYQNIQACEDTNNTAYIATKFTSQNVIERLIDSYVEFFHPVFPILHVEAFSTMCWQLILVTASIGARYLKDEVDEEAAAVLTTSLERLVNQLFPETNEKCASLPQGMLERTQLELLCWILSQYSGLTKRSVDLSIVNQLPNLLIQFCVKDWDDEIFKPNQSSIYDQWSKWKQSEIRRRIGYAIWLLDSMTAIHFQQRPRLTLSDAQSSLPCSEELWSATNASDWQELSNSIADTPSLNSAVRQLYIEKKLSRRLGEWSRVLIIHGLFRRMWETESYLAHPLSQWTPTARAGDLNDNTTRHQRIWLPSVPTYAKWRNSTCDCLDILHWSANATIGVASGLEHPTVMHLHFARVVLLTPLKSILSMAIHLAHPTSSRSTTSINDDINTTRRWAIHDPYKARLAMVHAGVLFWHIRRYSSGAFYEPASVALSTLSLWAFSTFAKRSKPADQIDGTTGTNHETNLEDNFYDIILLDRPTDDELVQQFIKYGHKMRANMNGIGDLYGNNAPIRVLYEGRKLLLSITGWKDYERWLELLDLLILACELRDPAS